MPLHFVLFLEQQPQLLRSCRNQADTDPARPSDKLGQAFFFFFLLFREKINCLWGAGAKLPSA